MSAQVIETSNQVEQDAPSDPLQAGPSGETREAGETGETGQAVPAREAAETGPAHPQDAIREVAGKIALLMFHEDQVAADRAALLEACRGLPAGATLVEFPQQAFVAFQQGVMPVTGHYKVDPKPPAAAK